MTYSRTTQSRRRRDRAVHARNRKTIAVSLPPEVAEPVEQVMREEGGTTSELVREAIRNYMDERDWLRATRYEKLREREAGRARTTTDART